MVSERIEIEQALAGMAVLTITAIQHDSAFSGLIQLKGQLGGDIRAAMADHQHVSAHRDIGASCIEQGFAFAQGTAGGRKALHISR